MKKVLSLNDFTILLIATLAKKSELIDFVNPGLRTAMLPSDYKQRIENIMCAGNGWKDEFSILIDTDEYFEDHFFWEQKLATQIQTVLMQLGKSYEYDFLCDSINIRFTESEVDEMLSYYESTSIKNKMDHFVSLLSDYIYSREAAEQHFDYSSRSVEYMRSLKPKNE